MIDDKSLVAQSAPKSPISEAYRVLRTNIQFSSVDKPLKSLVITSSGPSEGKTTTICNLAVTLAQSGSRVLIIDADLRKPKVHKVFGVGNTSGLTNILAQNYDYKLYLRRTEIQNIDLITAGPIPPNPSELLASQRMKQFLAKVSEGYDYILLDSPPVGSVTDAAILSTIVDGTILVVASGIVKIDAAKRSKELLEKVNANIVGVVLNKLIKNAGNHYYYYYYYYGEDSDSKTARKVRKKQKRVVYDD